MYIAGKTTYNLYVKRNNSKQLKLTDKNSQEAQNKQLITNQNHTTTSTENSNKDNEQHKQKELTTEINNTPP